MDKKSVEERLEEKYEDRGWGEYTPPTIPKESHKIEKLPISEREYQTLSLLLGKLALQDQDKKFCDDVDNVFMEIQRRATFGNHYKKTEELEEVERKMWTLGTKEEIELPKSTKSTSNKR